MKTPEWIFPAVAAMLLWGVWGVFQKLATNQMAARSVYFMSTAGALLAVFLVLLAAGFPAPASGRGALFAVLAGFCSSLGGLLFLHSLSRGEAAIVITFTALYPLVTIILSFTLLRETITAKQGIGIVMALVAMAMMAG